MNNHSITGAVSEDNSYYSLPGAKEFEGYFRQHRFFRIRDVLGFMLRWRS